MAQETQSNSLGERKRSEVFQDKELQGPSSSHGKSIMTSALRPRASFKPRLNWESRVRTSSLPSLVTQALPRCARRKIIYNPRIS